MPLEPSSAAPDAWTSGRLLRLRAEEAAVRVLVVVRLRVNLMDGADGLAFASSPGLDMAPSASFMPGD